MWTLKYKGEEKTLHEWGINRIRKTTANQGLDVVQFDHPVDDIMADQTFAQGDLVEIFLNDKRWFYGEAEDVERAKSGHSGVMEYSIVCPWRALEEMGFRQHWKIRPDITQPGLVDQYNSYVLLGTKSDGTLQTLGDQIAEALQYAKDQGAPIDFSMNKRDGSLSLPAIYPPIRDVWNAPVSQVVRKMLEWCPDVVCAWDYSTEPFPTLRIRRRVDQDASTVNLKAKVVADWSVRPRNDLKVPGVIIYYITTSSENGSVYSVINEDKYPANTTGRERRALLAAINLEGMQATYAQASIQCLPIEANSADWWKRHLPELQSANIQNLTVRLGSFVDANGNAVVPLPNELIGQWAPWMGGSAVDLTVKALASYEEKNSANETIHAVSDKPVFFSLTATNLASGLYRSTPGGVAGEVQPVGLAKALYEAANELHFSGKLVIKEQQCSGAVPLGNVLNLIGGRQEWAEMRAQIQTVSEDIDTGTTTAVFGPPKYLGVEDYIDLLRATWNRVRWAAASARASGVTGASSAILGQTFPKQVPASNQGGVTQQVWFDPTEKITGKITFSLVDTKGKHCKYREMPVCVKAADGTLKDGFIMTNCSEVYFKSVGA